MIEWVKSTKLHLIHLSKWKSFFRRQHLVSLVNRLFDCQGQDKERVQKASALGVDMWMGGGTLGASATPFLGASLTAVTAASLLSEGAGALTAAGGRILFSPPLYSSPLWAEKCVQLLRTLLFLSMSPLAVRVDCYSSCLHLTCDILLGPEL